MIQSKKELLMSVHIDAMIAYLNKRYRLDYFSALEVVLSSDTYKDLYEYDWFRQESPLYVQSCFEEEIASKPSLTKLLTEDTVEKQC